MEQQTRDFSKLLERITIDPNVCHGKPCIRGLRYPLDMILELLSAGMSREEILEDYEDLEAEDLLAVLAFAIWLIPVLEEAGGWGIAWAVLAVGPGLGTIAMLRLRALPESRRLAGGRR